MTTKATLGLAALAALLVTVELGTALIPPYGLFHDELYYWAGSQRLAFPRRSPEARYLTKRFLYRTCAQERSLKFPCSGLRAVGVRG